jgi:hypothetical protein
MKKQLLVLFVSFSLILGCSSMGNKRIADKKLISRIKEGRSTKADVRSLLGQPNFMRPEEKLEWNEVWEYSYTRVKTRPATFIPCIGIFFGGSDIEGRYLYIYFKDEIVEKIGLGQITGGGGSLLD